MNPPGDQARPYVRATVNGVFNEHLDGLDTRLEEGDRVALMYPFVFCVEGRVRDIDGRPGTGGEWGYDVRRGRDSS